MATAALRQQLTLASTPPLRVNPFCWGPNIFAGCAKRRRECPSAFARCAEHERFL